MSRAGAKMQQCRRSTCARPCLRAALLGADRAGSDVGLRAELGPTAGAGPGLRSVFGVPPLLYMAALSWLSVLHSACCDGGCAARHGFQPHGKQMCQPSACPSTMCCCGTTWPRRACLPCGEEPQHCCSPLPTRACPRWLQCCPLCPSGRGGAGLCSSARAVEGLRRWLTRLQEADVSVPSPCLSLNLPVLCTLLLPCNGSFAFMLFQQSARLRMVHLSIPL